MRTALAMVGACAMKEFDLVVDLVSGFHVGVDAMGVDFHHIGGKKTRSNLFVRIYGRKEGRKEGSRHVDLVFFGAPKKTPEQF